MLNRLQAGAGTYACGGYLAGLGSLQRSEICTALLFSRLERKMRMVDALQHFEEFGEVCPANWSKGKDAMEASGKGVADYLSKNPLESKLP